MHLITKNILLKFEETFDNPAVKTIDFGVFHLKFLRNILFTMSEYEEGMDLDKMKKKHRELDLNYEEFYQSKLIMFETLRDFKTNYNSIFKFLS